MSMPGTHADFPSTIAHTAKAKLDAQQAEERARYYIVRRVLRLPDHDVHDLCQLIVELFVPKKDTEAADTVLMLTAPDAAHTLLRQATRMSDPRPWGQVLTETDIGTIVRTLEILDVLGLINLKGQPLESSKRIRNKERKRARVRTTTPCPVEHEPEVHR